MTMDISSGGVKEMETRYDFTQAGLTVSNEVNGVKSTRIFSRIGGADLAKKAEGFERLPPHATVPLILII